MRAFYFIECSQGLIKLNNSIKNKKKDIFLNVQLKRLSQFINLGVRIISNMLNVKIISSRIITFGNRTVKIKWPRTAADPQIMSFCPRSCHCNLDDMPQGLDSCWYHSVSGKIIIHRFCLKLQNLPAIHRNDWTILSLTQRQNEVWRQRGFERNSC